MQRQALPLSTKTISLSLSLSLNKYPPHLQKNKIDKILERKEEMNKKKSEEKKEGRKEEEEKKRERNVCRTQHTHTWLCDQEVNNWPFETTLKWSFPAPMRNAAKPFFNVTENGVRKEQEEGEGGGGGRWEGEE